MEPPSRLVAMCIDAACEHGESVGKWSRQRRTLERLPSSLADALLRRLLYCRLLYPSLLEVFNRSVEVVDLRGESAVDAEWMAYLGAFRYLRLLNLADCHRITSSSLWPLAGLNYMREIDLSRCLKVTDTGVRHLLSLSTLEILRISETSVTSDGVALLSSLGNLSLLDLGGLPVTDTALNSLLVMKKLEHLDLWGSSISNEGAMILQLFPKLRFLNLAWTRVSSLPNLPSLESLNLCNCSVDFVLNVDGSNTSLTNIVFSGVTFLNDAKAFSCLELNSICFLDLSSSSLREFCFLSSLKLLQHLDLSCSMFGDDSVQEVKCVGANLRNLVLSKTRVTSAGIAMLAPHLSKLELLSLSHTPVDDSVLSHVGTVTSLKVVDLSNTNVRGFVSQAGTETTLIPSLSALQKLNGLLSLNLEHTLVGDVALGPLSSFQELCHLSLGCAFLADETLHALSALSRMKKLSICDAVVTDRGLNLFVPPPSLKMLDLRGCWLLTEDVLSSFCKKHPEIELRHARLSKPPSHQGSSKSSPSCSRAWPSQVNQKHDKFSSFWSISPTFIDQRLKYGRQELLALQPPSQPPSSSSR